MAQKDRLAATISPRAGPAHPPRHLGLSAPFQGNRDGGSASGVSSQALEVPALGADCGAAAAQCPCGASECCVWTPLAQRRT